MVCTGCSGSHACTVETGDNGLPPSRCISDPANDQYAEWIDTTGKTKVKLAIADAAIEAADVFYKNSADVQFTVGTENQKKDAARKWFAMLDLCKKLEATS